MMFPSINLTGTVFHSASEDDSESHVEFISDDGGVASSSLPLCSGVAHFQTDSEDVSSPSPPPKSISRHEPRRSKDSQINDSFKREIDSLAPGQRFTSAC